MFINTKSSPVEISSSLGTSSFSIAMNAKAFRVLSDTLYQNKIGSIVREVCCNAVDGHTANGNMDQPFEVHLPDHFEPWFADKDFGIGLTPDAVVTVATKLKDKRYKLPLLPSIPVAQKYYSMLLNPLEYNTTISLPGKMRMLSF